GGDELIDDHLRGVPEITELRFPRYEAVRSVEAVTVLETQHARFRERAVVNINRSLVRRQILIREVQTPVLHIVQDGVPMAERSALGVLPEQTNSRAFRHESRKCERFTSSPIERTVATSHKPSGTDARFDLRMWMEALGQICLHFEQ